MYQVSEGAKTASPAVGGKKLASDCLLEQLADENFGAVAENLGRVLGAALSRPFAGCQRAVRRFRSDSRTVGSADYVDFIRGAICDVESCSTALVDRSWCCAQCTQAPS